MRRKKHEKERIERCGRLFVKEPGQYRGRWGELFGNGSPLMLEVGCGKGGFITETALQNPGVNFLAIEKSLPCLVAALERTAQMGLANLYFSAWDAQLLEEFFLPGEVKRIYLNFSDPWPKGRQAKRRLTHSRFLKKYKTILKEGGEIFFKTDNKDLFDFSLEEFEKEGFILSAVTYDLHNSGFEGNIQTEYEKNFSQMGIPICRLEARKG